MAGVIHKRLLAVEDDPTFRAVLTRMATEAGYEICGAASGEAEAVALAKATKPDGLLMDVHLSPGCGIAAATAILAELDIPVVFISGDSTPPTVEAALNIRSCGFLVKPFSDSALQVTVELAFARHAHEHELRGTQKELSFLKAVADNSNQFIYAKDLDGRFLYANAQFSRALSMPIQSVLGKTNHDLFPRASADVFHANDAVVAHQDGILEFQEKITQPGGSSTQFHSVKFPLKDAQGKVYAVAGISGDVTEQVRASQSLVDSLAERDTLLREVHHRVKNNMQLVTSLLGLQIRAALSPELQGALRESQARIRSMALVHEALYLSHDFAHFDAADYLRSVCASLGSLYGSTGVTLALEPTAALHVPVDLGPPLGLLLTELVTNAYKHGYPAGRKGRITAALSRIEPGEVELSVADDGVGFAACAGWREAASVGLQIVSDLAEKQLRGAVTVDAAAGTRWTVRFPLPPPRGGG